MGEVKGSTQIMWEGNTPRGESSPDPGHHELVRLIFSWSFHDIMNHNLFADKVPSPSCEILLALASVVGCCC
jgi:hypothetical protein